MRNDHGDQELASGEVVGDGSSPGNVLLRNDGPGCGGWCFEDVSEASGTDVRANAMGLAVGDVDGDGDDDLFFSNSGWRAGPTTLLRNEGDGTFTDASAELGVDLGEWSWGTSFLDADNDGRLDIVLATGFSELAYQAQGDEVTDEVLADPEALREAILSGDAPLDPEARLPDGVAWPVADDPHARTDNARLLLQQPDGTFRISHLGPTDQVVPSHYGTAVGDLDNDGWPDIVLGTVGAGYRLLHNRTAAPDHHRLVVDLAGDGRTVNRDAVGARVTIVTSDGRRVTRAVHIGGSLGSGDELRLLFGLGDAAATSLEVTWPDGTVQEATGDLTDRLVSWTYGSAGPERAPLADPA